MHAVTPESSIVRQEFAPFRSISSYAKSLSPRASSPPQHERCEEHATAQPLLAYQLNRLRHIRLGRETP